MEDGYIACGECGLVCEETPVVVSDPFARNGGFLSSHAVLHRGSGTLVGFATERGRTGGALQRGARLVHPDYSASVRRRGDAAIGRILSTLGHEQQEYLFTIASRLFWQFYLLLPKGSSARNVDALATAAIYRAATRAKVAVNPRRLVAAGLPDPRLRTGFKAVLKVTAPLCSQPGGEERLLITVRGVAGSAGISPRAAHFAGKLARHYAWCFPSSKAAVSAAAIVLAACVCTEEGVPTTLIAGAAGVAPSAVLRCTRTAVRRRSQVALVDLRWSSLKVHLCRIFGEPLWQAPVPPMVEDGFMPAGAAAVAGYVAAEVESRQSPGP